MISKISTAGIPCVKVYALGGLDENGKNLYCIETPDSIFVVEAGSKYPDTTDPGVDVVIPDFSYLERNKEKIKAIIISHGHDDVYGALPYLLKKVGWNIPIYTTLTTKTIIEEDFKNRYKQFNFRIIKPSDDLMIASYPFHFFETTHAVMESFGFCIETEAGNIVYTGNYISDFGSQDHFKFDLPKIAKIADIKKTLLILNESSGAELPGIASPTHRITPHIKNLFEEGEKRIFIATYNQNLYVISEIIKLVIANNKKLIITNDKLLDALPSFMANGDLIIPRANQGILEDSIHYNNNEVVVLITGAGEELYKNIIALARGESPLSKYLRINPNDAFVMACPPAPLIETIATDAEDSLYKTDCQVIYLKRQDLSAMHAQQEDIKMMISMFHPRYYMPIQGEFRLLRANASIALSLGYKPENIFLLDNGQAVSFDRAGKALPITNLFKADSIFVDGLGVGDVKTDIIDERNAMAESGVIVFTAYYSSLKQKIYTIPDIETRGLIPHSLELTHVLDKLKTLFVNNLNKILANPTTNSSVYINKFIDIANQEIKKSLDKKPLIIVNAIDLDK